MIICHFIYKQLTLSFKTKTFLFVFFRFGEHLNYYIFQESGVLVLQLRKLTWIRSPLAEMYTVWWWEMMEPYTTTTRRKTGCQQTVFHRRETWWWVSSWTCFPPWSIQPELLLVFRVLPGSLWSKFQSTGIGSHEVVHFPKRALDVDAAVLRNCLLSRAAVARKITTNPYFHLGEFMTGWLPVNISCHSHIKETLAHNFKRTLTLTLEKIRYFCSWRSLREDIYYLIC